MHIHIAGGGEPPSAPKSVKRYLDALTGIAYADDRQLGHLLVRRFAPDRHRASHKPDRSASVQIVITLRLYVADYDRVFARRDDLTRDGDVDHEAVAFFEDDDPHNFEHGDLDDLLEERREDTATRGFTASTTLS